MTTEFTQENFSIDFDEQNNVVEIQYQGVNAALLALLSSRVDELEFDLDAALANVNGNLGSVAVDLSSLSNLITVLGNSFGAETLARISGDELNSTNLLAVQNQLIDSIVAETTARGAALLAEAQARGVAILNATGTITTNVANLASTVSGIAAALGGAEASIILVQDALATETGARTAQYSSILADFGNTNAAVLSEAVARANADNALALQIDALSASTGTTVFAQDDEPTTGMIPGDVWYDTDDDNRPYRYTAGAGWVDVSDLRIIQNQAAILQEAQARIEGDQLNASLINLVSVSVQTEALTREQAVNGLQGQITTVSGSVLTEQSARIEADGQITSKYTVKVDAGGRIAGFGLIATSNNAVPTSAFVVTADSFRVFNGSSNISPFSVSGGVVRMTNVLIEDATINSLTMSKVTSGNLTAALNGMATGVIRFGQTAFDTGTGYWLGYAGGVPKLSIGNGGTGKALVWDGTNLLLRGADLTLDGGAGFVRRLGTDVASTYIDWYGSGSVTDSNAKFYIKKTGQSFFGGEILASFRPRAWARFYKTSSNAIFFTRQLGFASAFRLDTGRYQFNFLTPQPNRFYLVFCVASNQANIDTGLICAAYDVTTTSFKLALTNAAGNYRDTNLGQLVLFGSDEVATEPPPGYDFEDDPLPPSWPPGSGVIP